jgi:hypothetical protein
MNGNNRPKVDLALNEEARLKLLKDKCYEGSNSYGKYYLYSVDHSGEEKAFFATADIHQQILEAGLKCGDEFVVRKFAVPNGKKVSSRIEFEVVKKTPLRSEGDGLQKSNGDGLKALMENCVQEAVDITKAVTGVSWQNEDVQKIASCLFIARSRG